MASRQERRRGLKAQLAWWRADALRMTQEWATMTREAHELAAQRDEAQALAEQLKMQVCVQAVQLMQAELRGAVKALRRAAERWWNEPECGDYTAGDLNAMAERIESGEESL